jgi:hypothetical protein
MQLSFQERVKPQGFDFLVLDFVDATMAREPIEHLACGSRQFIHGLLLQILAGSFKESTNSWQYCYRKA